ncbi:hypothetical protein O5D80_003725 [Batrachochytrium dendrobatidis]|nr:hypothetical protein O5D80_003725 [Batrachochytrium dendrobatidis]
MADTGSHPSILVAVRIHRNNQHTQSDSIDLVKLCKLVTQSKPYATQIAIAYPQSDTLLHDALVGTFHPTAVEPDDKRVVLVPVVKWGRFIPALNALLLEAVNGGFKYILYQSVEAVVSANEIHTMISWFDQDTLVVGKALSGHAFTVGKQRLNGVTTPWNTLALWAVSKLKCLGFLMVAEGSEDVQGGVEEVSAIAVFQKLVSPNHAKAILLRMSEDPSQDWDTQWTDQGRQAWHDKKMQSKVSRPAEHLRLLQLDTFEAIVNHEIAIQSAS